MFTLYRMLPQIAFAPVRTLSPIRLLFTHKNGDFGAIFVTERGCAAPRRSLKWGVPHRIGLRPVPVTSSCRQEKLSGVVRT